MKKLTINDFCKQTNFPVRQYFNIVNFCKNNKGYSTFKIPKKSGGERIIYAPSKSLKVLQRKIKKELENKYTPPGACHGFVSKRSCITNANLHVNKKWCLNFDISDFFPSINFGRILGLFKSPIFNFNNALATTLAIICCHEQKLPQGAPTSPILANMICYQLDKKLISLAVKNTCYYSRYADDITFSSNLTNFPRKLANYDFGTSFVELSPELNRILLDYGFAVNESKTRIAYKSKCQMVTGIVVNKKLNLKRKYYRVLRATIYNCKKEGILATAKKNGFESKSKFKNFVLGKLSYYRSVVGKEHSSYNTLCKMYNSYIENKFHDCNYNLEELNKNALFVIENNSLIRQGTAFLTDNNKLYTCKHVFVKLFDVFEPDELMVELKRLEEKVEVYNFLEPSKKYKVKNIKFFNVDIAEFELDDYNSDIKFKFSLVNVDKESKYTLLGFPNYSPGATPNIQEVVVTSQKLFFQEKYFTLDKYVVSGTSGGPVLDMHNHVVGIATNGGGDEESAGKTDANMFYPINQLFAEQ